jgi:hypothetical protein
MVLLLSSSKAAFRNNSPLMKKVRTI